MLCEKFLSVTDRLTTSKREEKAFGDFGELAQSFRFRFFELKTRKLPEEILEQLSTDEATLETKFSEAREERPTLFCIDACETWWGSLEWCETGETHMRESRPSSWTWHLLLEPCCPELETHTVVVCCSAVSQKDLWWVVLSSGRSSCILTDSGTILLILVCPTVAIGLPNIGSPRNVSDPERYSNLVTPKEGLPYLHA